LESHAVLDRGKRVNSHQYCFSEDYEPARGANISVYRSQRVAITRAEHKKRKGETRGLKQPRGAICHDWWTRDLHAMQACDHPHICKIYEHFTSGTPSQIVELCTGRSLAAFCKSPAPEELKVEAYSGLIVRQVLSAIAHLHEHGFCHLELQAEDYIFSKVYAKNPNLHEMCIKLVSFGAVEKIGAEVPALNARAKANIHQTHFAPEQAYADGEMVCSDRCDIWAVGVIAFHAVMDTFPAVCAAGVRSEWRGCPSRAKQMIQACLSLEPSKRPTAAHLLETCSWMQHSQQECGRSFDKSQANMNEMNILQGHKVTPEMVVESFRTMANMTTFQRVVVTAAVHRLPPERLEPLRRVFEQLDTNGNGSLSVKELVKGLGISCGALGSEFAHVLELVDTDGSRSIDYTEFIAATYGCRRDLRDEVCKATFALFDQDRSGNISLEEIKKSLGLDEEAVQELDALAGDEDGDGEIDFEEFKRLLKGNVKPTDNRKSGVSVRKGSKEPPPKGRSRSRTPDRTPREDANSEDPIADLAKGPALGLGRSGTSALNDGPSNDKKKGFNFFTASQSMSKGMTKSFSPSVTKDRVARAATSAGARARKVIGRSPGAPKDEGNETDVDAPKSKEKKKKGKKKNSATSDDGDEDVVQSKQRSGSAVRKSVSSIGNAMGNGLRKIKPSTGGDKN